MIHICEIILVYEYVERHSVIKFSLIATSVWSELSIYPSSLATRISSIFYCMNKLNIN